MAGEATWGDRDGAIFRATGRQNTPRACKECHRRKIRCSGEHPFCRRCEKACIDCEYSIDVDRRMTWVSSKQYQHRSKLKSTPVTSRPKIVSSSSKPKSKRWKIGYKADMASYPSLHSPTTPTWNRSRLVKWSCLLQAICTFLHIRLSIDQHS